MCHSGGFSAKTSQIIYAVWATRDISTLPGVEFCLGTADIVSWGPCSSILGYEHLAVDSQR